MRPAHRPRTPNLPPQRATAAYLMPCLEESYHIGRAIRQNIAPVRGNRSARARMLQKGTAHRSSSSHRNMVIRSISAQERSVRLADIASPISPERTSNFAAPGSKWVLTGNHERLIYTLVKGDPRNSCPDNLCASARRCQRYHPGQRLSPEGL